MRAHSCSGRNDVSLLAYVDGEPCGHFRLREFEDTRGFAMVHVSVLASLERVRRDLCAQAGSEVWVMVTEATLTPEDLARRAERLGWREDGGCVARRSMHLAEFGGIAVDLVAVVAGTRERIPQRVLGDACRRHFDWVEDNGGDGHVHADNRERSGTVARRGTLS